MPWIGCASEDKYNQRREQERIDRLEELQRRTQGFFVIMSLAYVAVLLAGPSAAEVVRSTIASKFKLPREQQLKLATLAYYSVVTILVLSTFTNQVLSTLRLPVFILLGGTLYPFFAELLPGISCDQVEKRKAGLSKIKSLLFLIGVMYIALLLFQPQGLGPIQLN